MLAVRSWLPAEVWSYLNDRRIPYALPALFILGFLYQQLTGIVEKKVPLVYSSLMIYGLLFALLLMWLKAPRWSLYLTVGLLVGFHLLIYTENISRLGQDASSTRDDAVEMTTRAFLQGQNPWNHVEALGTPATTGPASILLALPFVALFNDINELTLLFWLAFFAVLLIGDLRKHNNTFFVLALLFLVGIFETTHTLFWSLEELYFPVLFFPLAVWSIRRGSWYLAGACLALPVLFRLNHVFLALGFLLWLVFSEKLTAAILIKLAAGAFMAAALVVLPFLLVGRGEFLSHNPWTLAYSMSAASSWPANNLFFRGLNFLGRHAGPTGMRLIKLGLVTALMALISLRLKKLSHPYWHIAAGAFLAQTIAWLPARLPEDYELLFLLPVMLAVAFSPLPAFLASKGTAIPTPTV